MLAKIREEADEIEAALDDGDPEELADETGDLLFALVNLARHVGADPESALRGTNAKFERRFAYIERALAAKGRSLEEATLEEMDALWNEAKGEKPSPAATQPESRRRTRISRAEVAGKPACHDDDRASHVRHGANLRHHDVALGLVDAHGHVEAPVVQLLVQHLGIAMQPADAGAVGGVDRQIERRARRRQPVLDRGQQLVDALARHGRDQEARPLRRPARGDVAQVLALLGIEAIDLVPDFDDARAGVGIDAELAQHGVDVALPAPRRPHARCRGHAG